MTLVRFTLSLKLGRNKKWKREILFYKNYKSIRDSTPYSLKSEVGDVILFRSSSLCHQRLNPAGVIHYRVAVNTFGVTHSVNRSEEMMEDTYPYGPPQELPPWFEQQFARCPNERNVIYEQKVFEPFWGAGHSLRYKIAQKARRYMRRGLRRIYALEHF